MKEANMSNLEFLSLIPVESDVRILASGRFCIRAHSKILASMSPVLEKMLTEQGETTVWIQGVPAGAVAAFVHFLYSSRWIKEEMGRYGMHMLVLSHVYQVRELKRTCERELGRSLCPENVVDMLKLAMQCDAPSLTVRCLKLFSANFAAVQVTEGWKFLQEHDPWLELHLLQFLDDIESSKKRRRRDKRDQGVYLQLNEAMECLQHIYTEGCTHVGPQEVKPNPNKGPCKWYSSTCRGLQQLILHFACCNKRSGGGCGHCKRMWQLLRLHSTLCDLPVSCKVPLCRQFKEKMPLEKNGDERWRVLMRKVVSAKAISSLSKRKRIDELGMQRIMT